MKCISKYSWGKGMKIIQNFSEYVKAQLRLYSNPVKCQCPDGPGFYESQFGMTVPLLCPVLVLKDGGYSEERNEEV